MSEKKDDEKKPRSTSEKLNSYAPSLDELYGDASAAIDAERRKLEEGPKKFDPNKGEGILDPDWKKGDDHLK